MLLLLFIYIFFVKGIFQNLYEFQGRETLATNWMAENERKVREGSFGENPEVDSIFKNSMDSLECLQILFNF